jgi:hypothetical protein
MSTVGVVPGVFDGICRANNHSKKSDSEEDCQPTIIAHSSKESK